MRNFIKSFAFTSFALFALLLSTPAFGSTITVMQGSDTLSNSRSVINTNFANLNTDKLQSGSTAASLTITNATIGTATLSNTLTVPNGGTGSTTLSSNQIILGNGTGNVKTVPGYGTSGQLLTSQGVSVSPIWASPSVDTTIPYTWTNTHTFTATTSIAASSVTNNALKLNGVPYSFPTTLGASSTALMTDTVGNLSWGTPPVSQSVTNLTVGPAFTQGQAGSIGPYQSDGGITLDTSGSGTVNLSQSVVVGSNSNRILVVVATANTTSATINSAKYNGVSMTQIDSGSISNVMTYTFVLVAPTTGTNNLVFTTSSGTVAAAWYSYYNAAQTGQPESHLLDFISTSGGTKTLATVANGSLMLSALVGSGALSGNGYYENKIVVTGSAAKVQDSGQVFPSATNINITSGSNGGGSMSVFMLSIAAYTTPSVVVIPASSANSISQFYNAYASFIGFANANISGGASGSFVVSGVMTGLSGLTSGSQYYLNNTAGTIGTGVGTNTRKVGISLSATSLLITNIW